MKLRIEIDSTGVQTARITGVRGDDPVQAAQLLKLLQPGIDQLDRMVKEAEKDCVRIADDKTF